MRARRWVLAGLLATSSAWAQQGPVDPSQPLPPGHPPVDGTAVPQHRSQFPQSGADEAQDVPAGTIVVRVVDVRGGPVPGATVRLGAMREGERDTPREAVTGSDGEARFDGLPAGSGIAYRASTDVDGARFGAMPFQLGDRVGYRVQLVRFDVGHDGRGVLLWDAHVEMRFRDDRLMVVERMRIANLSGMAVGDERPRPATYVPTNGLSFALPAGYTAFNTQASMDDVRVATEGDAAMLRGSIAPTEDQPTEVTFQYQVVLRGGEVSLRLGLPLPVVNAMVAVEAPRGLSVHVAGMPAAELREGQGDRILFTGVTRQPNDPALSTIDIRLEGIPSPAGPGRTIASGAAALLVLGALGSTLRRGGASKGKRTKAEIEAERDRALDEVRELTRRRDTGEVGPVTYEERRREVVLWLASLLRELDEASAAPAK